MLRGVGRRADSFQPSYRHLASESLSDLALTRDGIDTKIRIIPAVGSSGYSRVLVLEAL